MSLVIDLPPDQETRIQQEAARKGFTVGELVRRTLAERFPVAPDENGEALRLIARWISESPTDPEAVNAAEEDLRTFQRSLNETRREAGARLVYPDVE